MDKSNHDNSPFTSFYSNVLKQSDIHFEIHKKGLLPRYIKSKVIQVFKKIIIITHTS